MGKFEKCKGYDGDIRLPERSTTGSAGYDFYAPEDITIPSSWVSLFEIGYHREIKPVRVHTHVCSLMDEDEVLLVFNRSSNPGRGLLLANGVGVVDSDYYGNPSNGGDIAFEFYNLSPWKVTIKKGDKLGQGVYMKYNKCPNDATTTKRQGGFGSTGK